MRGLNEIIHANREASRTARPKSGGVTRYNVFIGRKKIKSNVTIAQCADIRSIQGKCRFVRA